MKRFICGFETNDSTFWTATSATAPWSQAITGTSPITGTYSLRVQKAAGSTGGSAYHETEHAGTTGVLWRVPETVPDAGNDSTGQLKLILPWYIKFKIRIDGYSVTASRIVAPVRIVDSGGSTLAQVFLFSTAGTPNLLVSGASGVALSTSTVYEVLWVVTATRNAIFVYDSSGVFVGSNEAAASVSDTNAGILRVGAIPVGSGPASADTLDIYYDDIRINDSGAYDYTSLLAISLTHPGPDFNSPDPLSYITLTAVPTGAGTWTELTASGGGANYLDVNDWGADDAQWTGVTLAQVGAGTALKRDAYAMTKTSYSGSRTVRSVALLLYHRDGDITGDSVPDSGAGALHSMGLYDTSGGNRLGTSSLGSGGTSFKYDGIITGYAPDLGPWTNSKFDNAEIFCMRNSTSNAFRREFHRFIAEVEDWNPPAAFPDELRIRNDRHKPARSGDL